MTASGHLGIDVSKDKLDVSVAWDNHHRAKRFQNNAAGAQALCEWLQRLGLERVHACLEATGRYGDVIALALHDSGYDVSVANPLQIKNFAKARLRACPKSC